MQGFAGNDQGGDIQVRSKPLKEGTFFIGGGGPGLRRGGSLVNILQIGEDQTCFICKRGRVIVFLARKRLLHVG